MNLPGPKRSPDNQKDSFRVVFCHPWFESLGIEYLSATLRRMGVTTRLVFDPGLFDDPFLRIESLSQRFRRSADLPRKVLADQPDLVLFSVMACNYRWALQVAEDIKRLADVPIVFGGVHVLAAPDAVLANAVVDYAIVGEGEVALARLVECLRAGEKPDAVPNLVYRRDGVIRHNPLCSLIDNLDTLPFPDKELFYREIPGFARNYTTMTRRGCVFRCAYCANYTWSQRYAGHDFRVRARSVDNVLEELSVAARRYHFDYLRINDDDFAFPGDWLREFCRRYKAEIGRPFRCHCLPTRLTMPIVNELKDAGCYQVCTGVQEVHEDIRRRVYNRFVPQTAIVTALSNLRAARLWSTVDNIIAYPGQTDDDLLDVAAFYLQNPVFGRFTVFRLIDYAGTLLVERAQREGRLSAEQVRVLESDPPREANSQSRGETTWRRRQIILFLIVMQIVPGRLAKLTLKRRWYRWLPPIDASLLETIWTLVTRDRFDPARRSVWSRYWTYGRPKWLGGR